MGLKDNTSAVLNQKITKSQAEHDALTAQITKLNAQRASLATDIAQHQARLADISVGDKQRLENTVERLKKQIKHLWRCKNSLISRFASDIQNKLNVCCEIANSAWLRDGKAIPYADLADSAELVEDAMREFLKLEDEKSDLKPLKEALNKIETKALTLDDSKNISRRKWGRALLGIGIVLAIAAIALFSLLFTPVVIGFGASFGVMIPLVLSGVASPVSMKIAYSFFSREFKPAPLPNTLLLFRDTLKDVVSGNHPNKPSQGKQMIRAMR